MHHQLGVRVGGRVADLEKQPAAILNRRVALAAPGGDGLPLDVFHHQVRPAVRRAAAVDEARDVRMIQGRQDLALAAEACEQFVGVEAQLNKLDGGLLLEVLVVAHGQIDRAHAAAPDFPHHPPGPQARAQQRVRAGSAIGLDQRLRRALHGRGDSGFRRLVRGQQRFDFAAQARVAGASRVEIPPLFVRR